MVPDVIDLNSLEIVGEMLQKKDIIYYPILSIDGWGINIMKSKLYSREFILFGNDHICT